ncbi:glutamate carboxypeptidase-like protein 1 [Stagonosporopsis vannaccii]|nr:glutamate carboxypeptidase-like protein 1 [Stagonosporopsis vannaccii]
MSDEKHLYDPPELPPIPTYDEATSSRHTSTARRGPNEVSDDAERQGLLSPDGPVLVQGSGPARRNGYYHPPSVQSVDDADSELGSPARASADDDDDHRRIIEEMDILDPESADDGRARRTRSRGRFSKRFYSLTSTLSSIHLPRLRWPRRLRPSLAFVTDRLPTVPDEYRPGWSVIARLCGLIVIVSLVYMLIVSEVVPMGGGFGAQFNAEWVRQQAQKSIEGWRIEKNLEYITSYDHLAGTEGSYVLGQWIEGKFKDAHMDTFVHDEYWVYMNYANKAGRSVEIVEPQEKQWKAKLEEPSVYNPPKAQTSAFHALSASGNVQGPLIYVNYCDKKDFKRLWDSGVDVQGALVLCRAYGTQPDLAMKIKSAQDAGVVGVLVYSDPAEDGFSKGSPWPEGKWRPGDSVQRGSAALSNMVLGDPLTPGKPSTKKQDRMPKDKNPGLVKIPSLPLSWKDAQHLIKSLHGIGEVVPDDWTGGVPDVGDKWYSGHPDKSPKVNLVNEQDEVDQQRITNVFGSIRGMEDTAHKIIIGNHRDSFCFGAADPGSGTAIMLEVVRVLGDLRAQGWRPLRTIEFASWDAGEYNRIGSTEHVEANVDSLRENALAYINIDAAITGDKLWANGSPLFAHAWHRVLDRLNDPHNDNKTLKEVWEMQGSTVGNLAANRDSAPFQFIAGTSSLDFGFAAAKTASPNTMAGSCYETFDWMAQHVDPGFLYHSLHAELLVLLILELSQEPIVPLRLTNYAAHLQSEGQKLLDETEKAGGDYDIGMFEPLVQSLSQFKQRADEFHKWETFWYNQVYATGGFETGGVTMQRINHNNKMGQFETALLDLPTDAKDTRPRGLPSREQFKHTLFAPSLANAHESSVFPFARDALEKRDWAAAKEMIKKTAEALDRAGELLGQG